MLFNSGLPDFFPAAFANAGDKNIIPATTTVAGAAALNTGWPPICSLPLKSGGKAPKREDLNGILYWLSLAMQRIQAGGFMPYNAAFATAIGGYPKGAFVRKAAGTGYWMSTADSNTTDPDGGSSVNWTDAGIADAGRYRGVLSSAAATVTLTAEHCGYLIVLYSGSAQTVYLPQESGLPVGWSVTVLIETLTGSALIDPYGQIDSGNGLVSTLSVRGMEEARLTWDGTVWRLGGSALRAVGEAASGGIQDVTASRNFGTTYTNVTLRPMLLTICYRDSGGTGAPTLTVTDSRGTHAMALGNDLKDYDWNQVSVMVEPGADWLVSTTGTTKVAVWEYYL